MIAWEMIQIKKNKQNEMKELFRHSTHSGIHIVFIIATKKGESSFLYVVFIGTMRVGVRNLYNRRYYVKLMKQLIRLV